MTIDVGFGDAVRLGSCNGCSIRMYQVAEVRLGSLTFRLCPVCADAVIGRLKDRPNFLRRSREPRSFHEKDYF
jgi:hypothetical protein